MGPPWFCCWKGAICSQWFPCWITMIILCGKPTMSHTPFTYDLYWLIMWIHLIPSGEIKKSCPKMEVTVAQWLVGCNRPIPKTPKASLIPVQAANACFKAWHTLPSHERNFSVPDNFNICTVYVPIKITCERRLQPITRIRAWKTNPGNHVCVNVLRESWYP